MTAFPYSIDERRPVTEYERAIIKRMVSVSCPEREPEVDALEVFARCGCGKCPTIMFSVDPDLRRESARLLADFQGGDADAGLIGLMLWGRDGKISELEAWSIDGREVFTLPALHTLRQMPISRP